jgi:CheY-like chemotaxis protein
MYAASQSDLSTDQCVNGDSLLLKVLIAEDDLMIASLSEDVLVEHGYEVCGIGRTVDQAVALGRHHKPDLAVIDMRMAEGGLGTEVAAQLVDLDRLGILYVTGDVTSGRLANVRGHARLAKPYRYVDLLRSLQIVLELVDTGQASSPFPDGFALLPRARNNPLATMDA